MFNSSTVLQLSNCSTVLQIPFFNRPAFYIISIYRFFNFVNNNVINNVTKNHKNLGLLLTNMAEIEIFYNALKGQNKRTAEAYYRDAKRFMFHVNKPIKDIAPVDVYSWFDYLRTLKHSERSINRYAWSLKRFFSFVGRDDIVKLIQEPTYQAPMPKWLSKDKIDSLLSKAQGKAQTILTVAYDLALRIGEVTLLQTDYFNPETKQIKVIRLKHKGHPNEYILPVGDTAAQLLVEYLKSRKERSPFVFPFSTSLVTYYYRQASKKAGIKAMGDDAYTFHCLRHSRITHMAIEMIETLGTVDQVRLAKFAGHLKTETTLLYIHLASEYLAFGKRG